jgi:hypothetical protein
MRRSSNNRPSSRGTLGSSKKIESPVSKVLASVGLKRESPKTKTAAGGNAREILPSVFERNVTPRDPKLSTVADSKPTRSGGKLAVQINNVDSSFHFPNIDSASSFEIFTSPIPQFMEDAIKRMVLGIEDPRELAFFQERITRPVAVR